MVCSGLRPLHQFILVSMSGQASGKCLASMGINHFGLIRQKSVRVFVFSDVFESRTIGPFWLRQKTAQCQKGRPFSKCHLRDSNAKFGNVSQDEKGNSPSPAEIPKCPRRPRTCRVSDQRLLSSAKMPRLFATDLASWYESPASAATLAMPQPVISSWTTGFISTRYWNWKKHS